MLVDPRRTARDVRRRLQLRVAGARGERLRRALHEPARSTGYGSAFGNAIKNAYPGKDFDDLMKGVDTVIAKGYVDEHNMFVYGCSGGGVLTAWIVGHTDRFAAAASNCPVINWMSFVGNVDGPAALVPTTSRSSRGRIRASTCAARRSCTSAT